MLTAFTAIDYAVDSVNYRADHGKLTESERYIMVKDIVDDLFNYLKIVEQENENRKNEKVYHSEAVD